MIRALSIGLLLCICVVPALGQVDNDWRVHGVTITDPWDLESVGDVIGGLSLTVATRTKAHVQVRDAARTASVTPQEPRDMYSRLTPSWHPGTRMPWFFSEHQHGTLGTREPFPDLYEICTIRIAEAADGRLWSEIFSGDLPGRNDVVCIPEGVGVIFDLAQNPLFRAVALKGKLHFMPTVSSQMTVGTIEVYQSGRLEMIPASSAVTMEMVFAGTIDTEEDPGQITIGIIADGGAVRLMGSDAPATRWTRTENALAGSRQITVEDTTGWRTGDEVHLVDTQTGARLRYDFFSTAYTYFTHPSFLSGLVPNIPGIPDEIRGQRISIDRTHIGKYGSFKRNHLEGIFGEGGISLNYSSPIIPATNQLREVTMKLHADNGVGLRTTHGREHSLLDPVWIGGGTAIKRKNGSNSHVYVTGGWRFLKFKDLCNPDSFCTFE